MAQTIAPSERRGPVSGTATRPKKRKPFLLDLYGTAVGKKYVMAITGILMMLWVLAHMIGNLKLYLGQEDTDYYAEFLKKIAYPILPESTFLWLTRGAMLVALVLHVHSAYSLTRLNRQHRSVKYQGPRDYQIANFASRTMRWTGIIVLLYLVWHLLDLTFGTVNEVGGSGEFVRGEVYASVVRSLERVPAAIFYILANVALGIHLFHGAWSIFQSLGWNNPRFNKWRRLFATGFAGLIVVGNVSFPVAVLAGVVG